MQKLFVILVLSLASIVGLIFYYQPSTSSQQLAQKSKQVSMHLSAADFYKAKQTGEYTVLDVRTAEEYEAGYIKGAYQIDYYRTEAFTNYLQTLDKSKKYLIYCRSGNRTGKVLPMMKNMGFSYVADLEGGFKSWSANNLPVEL